MSGGPESDRFTSTPHSQPQLDQQIRMPFSGDDSYRPATAPPFQAVAKEGVNLNSGEQKRRRGRPRKYGTDGSMAMVMAPGPGTQTENLSPAPSTEVAVGSAKKPRGRPPGSTNKKKQIEAIGSNGIGFIPHVINVAAGEDVSSKVVAFSQNGPRAVCILSATGKISNVTLSLTDASGGTATYEGRFDILSLSGSFMVSDAGDHKRRTGGLSTTLAGTEGRVFGGCVSGLLVAHSPVQVIVGSFLADDRKEPKSASHMEPLSGPPKVNMGGTISSPSQGTFSESSGGAASPHNLSSGACNNQPHAMSGMPWK
ncbi:hypothetical protein SASPL_131482 [Salvia splendens]|uniref:AT-hook motif nuclear-localized protein n=1 Tax=Salvia splendens TaxID=180675 RepID=A0A8X8X951_SALSN|nr:AT-hook motif nuclear-localized protein 10-like isoform X2 [Salvia splendens]KAG6408469.1 hypothetical protein SASPL_131482 [Salvia splendens]